MNKSELIKNLAEQSNVSLDEATLVVNTFVDCMKEALLAGDRVEVSPKRLPFFRAGKELKEYLNND